MKPEAFEQQLQRQRPRNIPPEWREEILAAAQGATPATARPTAPTGGWFAMFSQYLVTLLSPAPRAWGALAALWVVIAALNLAARDSSPGHAWQASARPALNWQEARRQQQQIFAELAGLNEQPVADRPRGGFLQPRSAAPINSVNV